MEDKKRPEIFLEVSGGSFRIATDEIACNVKVLTQDNQSRAVTPLPAAAPREPPAPPREDPFLAALCEEYYGDLTAATPAGAGQLSGRLASLLALATASMSSAAPEPSKDLGKAQAKMTDLRFSLTFLKNHALFKATPHEETGEITFAKGEIDKLAAKIAAAMQTLQDGTALLGEIKKNLLAAGESAAPGPLVGAAGGLLRQTILFTHQYEGKKAGTADQAEARQRAEAFLREATVSAPADRREGVSRAPGMAQERPPQSAQEKSPPKPVTPPRETVAVVMAPPPVASGGEGEMSDEEALAKLKELGL